MTPRESKLYQDQLYETKVLSPLAVAIMNTPEFQRLSGLKQLGFADVPYRGAHHTRFEHSVGTYFVCRTIMRRLVQNHERLGLRHPALLGGGLSVRLTVNPSNADLPPDHRSAQASWRGLTEVVSIAGLLHDLGHAPFGHTLEDEFAGIYARHDRLASPRLHTMLFHEDSNLARVFSDDREARWLPELPNLDLARLIYLVLSWKEDIEPSVGFDALLTKELTRSGLPTTERVPLLLLQQTVREFEAEHLFAPYVSDIVGNTICADLLDYLPRDRMNLGMSRYQHQRLQRYFTIRPGTLRDSEGLRLCIMVTRRGHGTQRRDVATSILAVMRERYEMAERVYYHHKKAAASAMLVKLLELAPPDSRPRDDAQIYPAPWSDSFTPGSTTPHLLHLSDHGLLAYLGRIRVDSQVQALQEALYRALRYRRDQFYRTLLVVDPELVTTGSHTVEFVTSELRGLPNAPSNTARLALEASLCSAATARNGEVIVYCPSQKMQAKEVDVRVEIQPDRVLPLRSQAAEFAYADDLGVLAEYYRALWRCYVFVSPAIFSDVLRAKKVVDAFCEHFSLDIDRAYQNVRTHDFTAEESDAAASTLAVVTALVSEKWLADAPPSVLTRCLALVNSDESTAALAASGAGEDIVRTRVELLLDLASIDDLIADASFTAPDLKILRQHRADLENGEQRRQLAARAGAVTYSQYREELLTVLKLSPRGAPKLGGGTN